MKSVRHERHEQSSRMRRLRDELDDWDRELPPPPSPPSPLERGTPEWNETWANVIWGMLMQPAARRLAAEAASPEERDRYLELEQRIREVTFGLEARLG